MGVCGGSTWRHRVVTVCGGGTRRHRVAAACGGSVRPAAGRGKGRTPLRRWPPDLHPPEALPRVSVAAACGCIVEQQCAAAAWGGIAWRLRVSAA